MCNTRLEFLEQQLKAMVHSLLIPTIIFWRDYQGRMNFFLCLLVLRTSVILEKDLLAWAGSFDLSGDYIAASPSIALH